MLRDGSTAAEAQARIDAQLPLSVKEQLAHVVIHNDADLDLLQQQVSLRHSTTEHSTCAVLCYAMPHNIIQHSSAQHMPCCLLLISNGKDVGDQVNVCPNRCAMQHQ